MEIKIKDIDFMGNDTENVERATILISDDGKEVVNINILQENKRSSHIILYREDLLQFRNALTCFIESGLVTERFPDYGSDRIT